MATKHDVLAAHLSAWLEAKDDKKRRGEIIRMLVATIHIHPKSVPRAMKRLQLRGRYKPRRPGRPRTYTPDVVAALFDVWELGDRCCGELLHPMMAEYVSCLRRDREWRHGEEATRKLLAMSERTVKRLTLKIEKKHGLRRGLSATRPSALKTLIPIFKGPWRGLPPGHGQIDTVAHCGDSILGDFIFTVNYTDAATYWVVPRAQWNKGQVATRQSLSEIMAALPFAPRSLHPDTGSEFVNWHLKGWCDREGIKLTRSEPGKKNDNMYMEERNGHVVRRYLGYLRFDTPEAVPVMNELYGVLSIYLNHFKAVRRQVSKDRVGSKYVRRYERRALTPYERVFSHQDVPAEAKKRLRQEHEALSPLKLRQEIATLIKRIYSLQRAARKRATA